ncbi:hypothetical protein HBI56_105320 [Parastagonospora nodorum]|uniref:Uncharacterized protein n=1 Tax=Phaeosphaeria nodorum (strain SN15 / ATCC MYA-4574 / FGSC 10173) TaxID=321614 RepID=A0A7U2I5P4_PHANO|nr:hypothetical protein HBH56_133580 [Parastagonospora nodorum]QRD02735.1 hypothetical protein JI435_418540 [Parastagonospora nodorum SN15]KAH3926910.1 hypothetical protein HBH54_159710 [Parastagonospora nodorum]KAH3949270.1 hypothetical protein HBH53_088660 [Parastagonospora nodorum]KAH3974530.1 hypothetical protein HBH52_133090 [Parastagonospora nodorum]
MKAEDCTTSACSRHVRYMNAPYTLHPRRIAASSDMGTMPANTRRLLPMWWLRILAPFE